MRRTVLIIALSTILRAVCAQSLTYEARAVEYVTLAQSNPPPVPLITDWKTTPGTITATVGAFHCDVFAQHPLPGQVQTACYLNGALVYNAVSTIGALTALTCAVVNPTAGGNLAWALIPATSPMLGYQIGAQAISSGMPFTFGLIGPPDPNNLAIEGTF